MQWVFGMKKNIRKILYSLSLLSGLALAPGAHAKIPVKAFKNVTRYFKKGKELNSPLVGEALLEAGTIFDVRFMGNFRTAWNETHERVYLGDSSDDPLWNLDKHLFPSPAGGLAVDTTGEYNFGGLVKDPSTVALLLNFANDTRKGKANLEAYSDKIFDSFKIDNKKKKNAKKQAILPLLDYIEQSIRLEQTGKSGYPAGMTEGVITAFFCEKFEDTRHIKQLLDGLDDDIVDRQAVQTFQEKDLLSEDYIDTLSGKKQFDMDDVYALANAGVFTDITPYKSGTHLKSNGHTYEYDRKTGQYLRNKKQFADCAEMGMRHLLNLLLFNAIKREFDLTHIKAYIAEHAPDNPYFANFLTFYEKQKPDDANNGDILMRSLFNAIMADLNTDDDTYKLDYVLGGKNEVNPGFINTMMVFKKVFSLQIEGPPKPEESYIKKREWLGTSLGVLFEALNPTKEYRIDLSGLKGDRKEISGDVTITVKDSESKKDQFSFTYMSNYDKHSEITKLTNLLEEKKFALDDVLDSHTKDTTIREDTTEEALRLLAKEGTVFSQAHHPLFQIFNKAMQDYDSMVEKLRVISQKYEEWKATGSPFESVMPLITATVIHILENTLSGNAETLQRIAPVLPTLAKQPEFADMLSQVKTLNIRFGERESTPFIDFSGLQNMKQLRELSLTTVDMSKTTGIDSPSSLERITLIQLNETEGQSLSLQNHAHLRELDLSDSGFQSVTGIETLKHLEKLSIQKEKSYSGEGMKSLSLKKANSLRDVDIKEVSLETLEGTEDLTSLEKLRLSELSGITELSLPNSQRLRDMELKDLPLENLDTLRDLSSLETLKLHKLSAMKSLDLTNCRELVYCELTESSISEINGLGDLNKLSRLVLRGMQNMKSLLFESLTHLTELNLTMTPLKSLEGIHSLTELTTLKFTGWKYAMTNLSWLADKPLPKVKELDLSFTEIESVKGLELLPELESLNLSFISRLSDISLKNEKLVELKLPKNKFQRINFEGCRELTEIEWGEGAQIKSFSMKKNDKLRSLTLPESFFVKKLELEDLTSLDYLKINFATHGYSKISLKNLDALEELDLSTVSSREINFAGTFKALKKITFRKVYLKDEEFKVEGLQELIDYKWKAREDLEIIDCPKGIILRKAADLEEDRGH